MPRCIAPGRRTPTGRRAGEHQQQLGLGQRCRAHHGRPQWRVGRLRCALRTARGRSPSRGPPVLQRIGRRRGRRRRCVPARLQHHPGRRRPGRGLPRLPLHRRAARGHDPHRGHPSCADHRRHGDLRGRLRARRVHRGADARGLRAQRRVARIQVAPGTLAGGALVHRGREPHRRRDRARCSG